MDIYNTCAGAPKPVGPYSQAVRLGKVLFLSGQIGIDPLTDKMVAGGIDAEVQQVLRNLDAVLRGAGSSPEQVVMTTIFLAAMEFGPTVNSYYQKFISAEQAPARQTVAVKELPLGALVEISLIAEVSGVDE